MNDINKENTIEFVSGQRTASVTFTNSKHISRIKTLYKDRPEEFKDYIENKDGSIYAKIPLKWIKINPGRNVSKEHKELSEEEKEVLLARLNKARAAKKGRKK